MMCARRCAWLAGERSSDHRYRGTIRGRWWWVSIQRPKAIRLYNRTNRIRSGHGKNSDKIVLQ
eukprot:scaffold40146_cov43-Phaeocystis_antarctica.AAC.2